MDDPLFVCRLEGFGDLLRYREGFIKWDRSLLDPIRKRRSFNKFKNQSLLALRFFQPVD